MKSVRWFMLQPAYADNLNFTHQHCINSDTPPKCLYTDMRTADWWWETQVWRDTAVS
jgi:hypothetical protein